jgi:hypothetical protein
VIYFIDRLCGDEPQPADRHLHALGAQRSEVTRLRWIVTLTVR